ncbi:FecR family protein [Pigmentiphaga litoralis]|uniref:FecR family protein n=1 Tax=Pigmentiphaga litoralis TaxID=516702 RepID=UPI003B434CF5
MTSTLPSRAMIERALLLVGRTHKASPDVAQAAREELARWRAGSPAHAQAVAAAERLWAGSDASALQGTLPLPHRQSPSQAARRRTLGMLGAGGVVAALAGGGRWYWQQPLEQLALSTGKAQQLDRTLSDRSELSLAARTACQVAVYRNRREVRLAAGEVRFRVTHDPDRPFLVMTDWGRVRVLGTIFTVSAREGHMRVAVADGRVGVWPYGDAGGSADTPGVLTDDPPVVLQAGQAIDVDRHGLGARRTLPPDDVGAWRQGWLVFDNTPLPEAVARWNDYVPQPFLLRDLPRLRELRVSGSFPLRDPQAFLQGLPDMLPVRVTRAAGEPATIELRSQK